MIAETSHYALILALAVAIVQTVLPLWGTKTRDMDAGLGGPATLHGELALEESDALPVVRPLSRGNALEGQLVAGNPRGFLRLQREDAFAAPSRGSDDAAVLGDQLKDGA
jgi:hypothetical protein